MIRRREILIGPLAVVMWAPRTAAQQAGRVARLGLLSPFSATATAAALPPDVVRDGLREHGWVEGRSLEIEYRYADGRGDRLDELVAGLVRVNVEVIVALANQAIAAAKRVTATVPIVMYAASHPVETGFISSFSHPGGNVTGIAYNPTEVAGKLVALLKEASPRISRVAVIWNPNAPGITAYKPETDRAARTLGVTLQWVDLQRPEDFKATLDAVRHGRAEALYVVSDAVVSQRESEIRSFASGERLPAIYTARWWVDRGGLMYYGPNRRALWQRTAYYIDKILKRARPADLPVETPAVFELIINVKTAKATGLTIPQSLLTRADQVIE